LWICCKLDSVLKNEKTALLHELAHLGDDDHHRL
jgi:hypothetical protein